MLQDYNDHRKIKKIMNSNFEKYFERHGFYI